MVIVFSSSSSSSTTYSNGTEHIVPLYEEFKKRGEQQRQQQQRQLLDNDNDNTNNNGIMVLPAAVVHMGSAVLAGGIADVLINPMFVVRTRMQTEGLHTHFSSSTNNNHSTTPPVRTSLYQTVRNLYKEGGVAIFWRGMTANLLGLSHVAVQFPIYEQLKQYFRQQQQQQLRDDDNNNYVDIGQDDTTAAIAVVREPPLTALQLLTASALSKLCACVLTYPHEVLRSRLMDSRAARVSLTTLCRDIYQSHGLAGFYAGLPISMVRVVPNTAIAFCVYELVLHELKQQQQQQQQQQ
jgi:solute carrier family 25 (mitochondrial folate transporter), member 32